MQIGAHSVVHTDILPQGEVETPRVWQGFNQGLCRCNASFVFTEQDKSWVGKHALYVPPQVHPSPLKWHTADTSPLVDFVNSFSSYDF